MKQWHFIYNGMRYYTGQVILMRGIGSVEPLEAVFVCYNTSSGRYTYKRMGCVQGSTIVPAETFVQCFAGVVEGKTEPRYVQHVYDQWYQRNKKLTLIEEIEQVEGMLGAWITYILALLASFVCKEWYMGWVLASVIFFCYRHKKLDERRDK
jgi:hypothetical protein